MRSKFHLLETMLSFWKTELWSLPYKPLSNMSDLYGNESKFRLQETKHRFQQTELWSHFKSRIATDLCSKGNYRTLSKIFWALNIYYFIKTIISDCFKRRTIFSEGFLWSSQDQLSERLDLAKIKEDLRRKKSITEVEYKKLFLWYYI